MNKKTDNMLGMLWHDTEYQDIIKDSKYNRLYTVPLMIKSQQSKHWLSTCRYKIKAYFYLKSNNTETPVY